MASDADERLLAHPEDAEAGPSPALVSSRRRVGTTSAAATTLVLLGDMFGLGSLTLPADFARLGWLPGGAAMALCAAGTLYSGRLFTALAENVRAARVSGGGCGEDGVGEVGCAAADARPPWASHRRSGGRPVRWAPPAATHLGTPCQPLPQVPGAHVFDDYGAAALGSMGRRLVFATVYLTIAGEPPIFALTSAEALQQLFPHAALSRTAAGLIVAAVVLPLAQVRDLEGVAAFSAVGVAGMAVALSLATARLAGLPVPGRLPTRLIRRNAGAAAAGAAIMDVVFTYGGQVNWVRYVHSMKDPRKFSKCVLLATAVMTAAYVAVGGYGYWVLGEKFDYTRPLTSILPPASAGTGGCLAFRHGRGTAAGAGWGPRRAWAGGQHHAAAPPTTVSPHPAPCAISRPSHYRPPHPQPHAPLGQGAAVATANAGLLAHCLLAYQINANVWAHLALTLVGRLRGGEAAADPHAADAAGRGPWLAATAACVAFSLAIAASLPYFSSLMAVIASLGDLAGAYALPALFLLKLGGPTLGRVERGLLTALVPAALGLSALGVGLSVAALVGDARAHRP